MKWAIVFYALVSNPSGDIYEHVTWGLTFNHHEQCIEFYGQNQKDIITGLRTFLESKYEEPILLQEVGCAHATADFDKQDQHPETSLHMPLWTGTSI